MQNGPDFDKLIAPFVEIYQNIEHDLLVKIASHFKLYEEIGFKNSMEWYIKKIEELGGLNQEAVNIISKYSKIPKSKIISMLKDAGLSTINLDDIDKLNEIRSYNIDKLQLINSQSFNNVIQNSYKELNDIFKLINTNAIEGAKEAYMSVLNQAYTEVSSGAFDYNTSIKKAINKMVNNGITVARYKQKDGSTRNYSVESSVRRDVLTAVVQCANRSSDNFIKELDAEYVEVSQHLGARVTDSYDYTNHSWWQGKIYKLEGSTDKYPNFQDTCNEGDIQGIGGVNCRHIKWAFFPGISVTKAIHISKEENDKLYEQKQTQRAYERKIRLYKNKIDSFKEIGDVDSVEKYKNKLRDINEEYNDYCDTNNLRRNYAREQNYTTSKDINIENKTYKDITQEWVKEIGNDKGICEKQNYVIGSDGIKYIVDDKNVIMDHTKNEESIAKWFSSTKKIDINMLPRVLNPKNVKTADFIEKSTGITWEIKEPEGNTIGTTMLNQFKGQKEKAHKFIIDMYKSEMPLDIAIKEIEDILSNKRYSWIEEVVLLNDKELKKVFKR